MKQRLGIAGALLSDPKLLLLDEPANGLDPAGIVAMRETLKHFASTGKTVFVSSHLLAEVQQLADVVGIIAKGKLVREGTMKELLATEGVVRVRVTPDEIPRAVEVLAAMAAPDHVAASPSEHGWCHRPDRAGPLGRDQSTLAQAGIYASGLEAGNDLEELFLALTRSETADPDGTFAGSAGRASRTDGLGRRMRLFLSTTPQARSPTGDMGDLRAHGRAARPDPARGRRHPRRRPERRRERRGRRGRDAAA